MISRVLPGNSALHLQGVGDKFLHLLRIYVFTRFKDANYLARSVVYESMCEIQREGRRRKGKGEEDPE